MRRILVRLQDDDRRARVVVEADVPHLDLDVRSRLITAAGHDQGEHSHEKTTPARPAVARDRTWNVRALSRHPMSTSIARP